MTGEAKKEVERFLLNAGKSGLTHAVSDSAEQG
jgi:hypothetical protein